MELEPFLTFLVQKKLLSKNQAETCLEVSQKDQQKQIGDKIFFLLAEHLTNTQVKAAMEEYISLQNTTLTPTKQEFQKELLAELEAISQKKKNTPLQHHTLLEPTKIISSEPSNSTILLEKNSPEENSPEESNTLIEERYLVLENLGEGGMGVVQRVQDCFLGREVALKRIKLFPQKKLKLTSKQQMLLWRLNREASITATLEHPNIIPLYDIQKKEDGELYFTMRKIEGETLAALLKEMKKNKNSYDEERLLLIYLKVCDAVAYAHNQGVVHRDLKPDNIMVGQFGEVYVMDWGIAKKREPRIEKEDPALVIIPIFPKDFKEEPLTETITVHKEEQKPSDLYQTIGGMGTPGYMPPEQMEDASQVRAQADIYALGILLRQIFTLNTPLEELRQTIQAKQKENQVEEFIPLDIKAIIAKATQANWQHRYASVLELSSDIEHYRKNIRISARSYHPVETLIKWMERNRKELLFIGTCSFLILSFWFYLQGVKKQEKWKNQQEINFRFEQKYQQALNEIKRGQKQIMLKEREEQGEKIKHYLKALGFLNTALSIRNEEVLKVQQKKFMVSQQLIQWSCQSQDYRLAEYLLTEIQSLPQVSQAKKKELQTWVSAEKNKQLNLHLTQLKNWVEKLHSPNLEESAYQNAIFAIAKMPEKEIYEKLVQFLQKGTQYFLNKKNLKSLENEFFKTMVLALGRMEKPTAGPLLLDSLKKMTALLSKTKPKFRSLAQIDFMVTLAHALEYSKAYTLTAELREIRRKMGPNELFGTRTLFLYERMIQKVSLKTKSPTTAIELLKLALLKQDQNDLKGAFAIYNKMLSQNPNDYVALTNRGYLKRLQQDFKGALQDYNKAIKIKPSFENAYNSRGEIWYLQNKFEAAIADFNEALRLAPDLASAYQNRAKCKTALNHFKEAITDYSLAIEKTPKNARLYKERGEVYVKQEQWRKAYKDYTMAIKLYPEYSSAYYNRAAVCQKAGKFKEALRDYNQAIQYNPQFPEAYNNRAMLKQNRGDLQGAIQDYDAALLLDPENETYYNNRGVIKYYQKDWKGALQDCEKAIQLNPNMAMVYYQKGLIYREQKKWQEAYANFNQSVIKDPKFAEGYYMRGGILHLAKKYKLALMDYEKALNLKPALTRLYYLRGNIQLEFTQLEKAKKDFKHFLKLTQHDKTPSVKRDREHILQKFPELGQ